MVSSIERFHCILDSQLGPNGVLYREVPLLCAPNSHMKGSSDEHCVGWHSTTWRLLCVFGSHVQPSRASSGGQGVGPRIQPMAIPQLSNPYVGVVALHNATALLPFSLDLAKSYV